MLLQNIISFQIMSQAWAKKNNSPADAGLQGQENYASRNANGTEPGLKLISWQPDRAVKLIANTDWWDKPGRQCDQLSYLPIKVGYAWRHCSRAMWTSSPTCRRLTSCASGGGQGQGRRRP